MVRAPDAGMKRRTYLAGLSALALAACASAGATQPTRYEGDWDWSFETSSFTTSDGRGPWWLSAESATWEALQAPLANAQRGPWGRVHVIVEGELSAPGHYGHLGAYQRELRVTRVIEARIADAPR